MSMVLGVAGILLGLYILINRIDGLRFGEYVLSYVTFWVALGSGCMLGGLFTISDDAVSYAYVALLVASGSNIAFQRRQGAWVPPAQAATDHGNLPDDSLYGGR